MLPERSRARMGGMYVMSRRIAERPYQARIAIEIVRAGVLCFVCFISPAIRNAVYGRRLSCRNSLQFQQEALKKSEKTTL